MALDPPDRTPLRVRLTHESETQARVNAGFLQVPMEWDMGRDAAPIDLTVDLMDGYRLVDVLRNLLMRTVADPGDDG